MAGAIFSTHDGILKVLNDVPMAGLDLCEQLLTNVQPTTVLVSARAPELLLDYLERRLKPETNNDVLYQDNTGSVASHFILRAMPSSDFSYDAACERLAGLDACTLDEVKAVFTATGSDSSTERIEVTADTVKTSESHRFRMMRCGSLIHLDSRVSVGCAGAVLADIHRRRSTCFLPDGQATEALFHVTKVAMFSMEDYMLVDGDTLLSLQIVQSELHPNSQAWGLSPNGSATKESLSVYGLFHTFACDTHWEALQVVHGIQPQSLMAVGELVNRTIDFEQSKSRQRPSIKAGINRQLDELKRQYDGMGSFLTEAVNRVNWRLPEWARCHIKSCIFLPQLGFFIVVEADPSTGESRYEGEGTSGDTWDKTFTAGSDVCYKNDYMRELDHHYGDMYCQIGDMEVELIQGLATSVLQHEKTLVAASQLCGEFDALRALALGAGKYRWVAPRMTNENILCIKGGRHPLQELVVPSFVSNDCFLEDPEVPHQEDHRGSKAIVLTGPNHSGKSIYLKQAAIIVYLAHIGSFVPAEHATIGLTDKILTRLSTRESAGRTDSAFATDLAQVTRAMRCSTPQSLILVDEFGKGTSNDDGAGLLAGLLEHFSSLGDEMPRVLLATHFHELIEGGFLDGICNLSFFHMSVESNWEISGSEDHITYLFKLTPGVSSSSFGSKCAALNGVPAAIVERSETICSLLARNEDLVSACAQLSDDEEKRLQEAEAVARLFIQQDLSTRDGATEEGNNSGSYLKAILQHMLPSASDGQPV
ncbi:muts domain V-domain-containing protein [Stachybotrys elegans]|uniref:DNA mismatch repair protein MSH5 n=1 Tax=Stachybotrys elegans TaxID=80388 RepID=A0A8K0T450_9HYPO|nr:muts domain V-domain-containing protein [Stachybotrys elegans]